MLGKFKNYHQIMIWAHNRKDYTGLCRIKDEIWEAYERHLITDVEHTNLVLALCLYLDDCEQAVKKEAGTNAVMAQGFDSVPSNAIFARPMEGML